MPCSHLELVTDVKLPTDRVCEACVTIGAQWVHLRTCQACGRTACCDSSPHRHASTHARDSGHPVIASAERGERWLYCYPDDAYAEYDESGAGPSTIRKCFSPDSSRQKVATLARRVTARSRGGRYPYRTRSR